MTPDELACEIKNILSISSPSEKNLLKLIEVNK
jgi:hypothetical protein